MTKIKTTTQFVIIYEAHKRGILNLQFGLEN